MKFLGIDYGRKKVGLAVSDGVLAEPLKVIRIKNLESGIKSIKEEIKAQNIQTIIIGMPEGEIGKEVKEFSLSLRKQNIEIIEWDETLSTQDAQRLSIEAGIKRKKRKDMEDAYSAAIILQSYLDTL